MKDLFDKALHALPAYVSHVLELLSGPKAFIEGKDLATAESARDAYTFLAITLFLVLVAQVSFFPEQKDYLLTFVSIAIQSAFGLILMVAVLYFVWKIVGGTLSFKTFFIVSCYYSGISTLILLVFILLASGLLKVLDPENAAKILHGGRSADPTSASALGFLFIICVGLIAVYVWIFVVWGAYRKLNNVSRARSAIALAVFVALSPLVMFIQYLMQPGLMPAPDHQGPAAGDIPLEMLGTWKATPKTPSEAAPSNEMVFYTFDPDGGYVRTLMKGFVQGACLHSTQENSHGHASVERSMLILAPRARVDTGTNSCSPEKSETQLDLDKEIYNFEVRHEPTGWVLCLSNRYGQQCFTATKL